MCEFCFNGQEAVQKAIQIYNEAVKQTFENSFGDEMKIIRPIALVLLDF